MKTSIPLFHILLTCSSIAILAGSLFVWTTPVQLSSELNDRPSQAITPQYNSPPPLDYNIPDQTHFSVSETLKISPFDKSRSAFTRQKTKPKSSPKKPTHQPEFIGTLGKANSRKAMIVWEPNAIAMTHSIGDDTPWGILTSISSTELIFETDEQTRKLSLF